VNVNVNENKNENENVNENENEIYFLANEVIRIDKGFIGRSSRPLSKAFYLLRSRSKINICSQRKWENGIVAIRCQGN
jgi:hypothetical protein